MKLLLKRVIQTTESTLPDHWRKDQFWRGDNLWRDHAASDVT
jgi:3-hydroxy-9,10-secoandrosta-1,3,5(10)-triene-9,17-dione monooxygenase reductase component